MSIRVTSAGNRAAEHETGPCHGWTFFLLAAAVLLLAALGGCPRKKAKRASTPGVCRSDKECGKGLHCREGRCLECANDHHCSDGMVCRNGKCRKSCATDDDCNKGQVCVEGACKSAVCSEDRDCPPDRSCVEGRCRRVSAGKCATDGDCPNGKVCEEGRCEPAPQREESGSCSLESIYFDYNKYLLRTESREALVRNADCLRRSNDRMVRLEGHCDPRGTEEYNLSLSYSRADAAKQYLVRMGIDERRFHIVPKGELEASGVDEESWKKDRKVVFEFE